MNREGRPRPLVALCHLFVSPSLIDSAIQNYAPTKQPTTKLDEAEWDFKSLISCSLVAQWPFVGESFFGENGVRPYAEQLGKPLREGRA